MATSAALDGQSPFGNAVKIEMIPNPVAVQQNTFFGLNGVVTLMGGTRGRLFNIEGCFTGNNMAACVTARNFLLSFADGLGHSLTDNFGTTWSNVIFLGALVCDD